MPGPHNLHRNSPRCSMSNEVSFVFSMLEVSVFVLR